MTFFILFKYFFKKIFIYSFFTFFLFYLLSLLFFYFAGLLKVSNIYWNDFRIVMDTVSATTATNHVMVSVIIVTEIVIVTIYHLNVGVGVGLGVGSAEGAEDAVVIVTMDVSATKKKKKILNTKKSITKMPHQCNRWFEWRKMIGLNEEQKFINYERKESRKKKVTRVYVSNRRLLLLSRHVFLFLKADVHHSTLLFLLSGKCQQKTTNKKCVNDQWTCPKTNEIDREKKKFRTSGEELWEDSVNGCIKIRCLNKTTEIN